MVQISNPNPTVGVRHSSTKEGRMRTRIGVQALSICAWMNVSTRWSVSAAAVPEHCMCSQPSVSQITRGRPRYLHHGISWMVGTSCSNRTFEFISAKPQRLHWSVVPYVFSGIFVLLYIQFHDLHGNRNPSIDPGDVRRWRMI